MQWKIGSHIYYKRTIYSTVGKKPKLIYLPFSGFSCNIIILLILISYIHSTHFLLCSKNATMYVTLLTGLLHNLENLEKPGNFSISSKILEKSDNLKILRLEAIFIRILSYIGTLNGLFSLFLSLKVKI